MSEQMKQFLKELADLIEKHDVELEVLWDSGDIGACMSKIYDWEHDNEIRPFCDIAIPSMHPADIRELIGE